MQGNEVPKGIKDLPQKQIYIITNGEGQTFTSKLVGCHGDKLIFESRTGIISLHDVNDIKRMIQVRSKGGD